MLNNVRAEKRFGIDWFMGQHCVIGKINKQIGVILIRKLSSCARQWEMCDSSRQVPFKQMKLEIERDHTDDR